MDVKPLQIDNYKTQSGKVPFEEWLNSISDKKIRVAIDVRIARLRAGNMGDARFLGGGLFELKLNVGPGYRIYFGIKDGTTAILLHGGSKDRQQADIDKASNNWIEFNRIR
jgi:putative addiction module killer protein